MKKTIVMCLLVMSTAAFSAFAQNSSSGNPASASTSNSGATAVVNNDNAPQAQSVINSYPQDSHTTITAAGYARQFPSAVPGVVGEGPFPGYALPPGKWGIYCPAFLKTVTYDEIDRMRKHSKAKVVASVWHKNPNDSDSITCIDWNAELIAHSKDRPIGEAQVTGKHGRLDIPDVMEGLHHLEKSNTNRVLILVRTNDKSVTGAHSFGLGILGSIMPGNPTKGASGTIGAEFGKSTTEVQDYPEFLIYALNNGPISAPSMPQQRHHQAKAEMPSPPQTVRVEIAPIKVEFSPLRMQPPIQTSQAPAPPPQAEACRLPKLTVYFDFDKSFVKSEYRSKIKTFAVWLGNHPACRVQVEGHASKPGSYAYNAALGRRRSKAVYSLLMSDGANPQQVRQFVSLSEDFPASEYQPKDRRVILRVIGPASGK